MKKILILTLLFAVWLTPVLQAQTPRIITPQDLVNLKKVSDPQISPDGSKIAFVVETSLVEDNSAKANIWVYDCVTKVCRPFTCGAKKDLQPRWSPDGKYLAFISNRSGSFQVWLIPGSGGEAWQLTRTAAGASTPCWSPDSRYIIFSTNMYPEAKTLEDNNQRIAAQEKSKVKARLYQKLMVRHWDSWMDGTVSRLLMTPVSGGDTQSLTPAQMDVPPLALGSAQDYAFAPDGTEISYAGNPDADIALSTNNEVFIKQLKSGSITKISSSPGNDCQPRYSPDGKYLAFTSMARAGFESDRATLMLYNRSNGSLTDLTPDFDYNIDKITWAPDASKLYFNVEKEGYIRLYQVTVQGKLSKIAPAANAFNYCLAGNGKFMAIISGSLVQPDELYLLDLPGGAMRQLSHINDSMLDGLRLGAYEEIWYPGADGVKIHGFLLKPPGFDPSRRYPLVLEIHGGPQQMTTNAFGVRWCPQIFASPGYMVAMLNPRGSGGYGQKFKDEISGDWGGKVYQDLMLGVDYLVQRYPCIDAERMAAVGGSYGGYMTNWIEGHTDRFKCLITHCGPYNLESKYGSTEELWFPEWEFKGTPWDNPEVYHKWSPSSYVRNFKTPMLIIHGQMDYRVPVEQALQMFTVLQRLNIPSQLLYFPDEGHWVNKPQNRLLWNQTFLDWLARWLKT